MIYAPNEKCLDIDLVMEAENGKELLEKIPAQTVGVVLLDLKMPVMDGMETTLQHHRQYPEIKILLLSMHDDEHLIAH